MNGIRFERLQDLVAEALERDPAERGKFLRAACGGEAELLAEVESLLGHEQAGNALLENSLLARFVCDGVSPETPASELQPGDTVGEYRVVSLLGEGGMGEVYLAEDTKLERRVALKLLKRRLGDDALGRRFTHERRVLAALTHPGIARLYGGDTTPAGRAYLVMEHVEGERLDVYCDSRRLKLNERLQLFRKICAAVSYAHQNLVVHRDLKPANIRVTREGEP
ncbi:MAG: serine/threonine protein kinase, partial [Rhodospirillales bacterium]|nr:serine/threonine protein kinase [Acetobacter sp.]